MKGPESGRGGLEQVRSSCRSVAEKSTRVRIDESRIPGYADALVRVPPPEPAMDPDTHFLDRGKETVAFFVTLDTINFGSGYFPHMKKPPGKSGYFTIAGALCKHFRKNGSLSAQRLSTITKTDCAGIFGQDLENPAMDELMGLFAEALGDLGRFLQQRFDGDFEAMIRAAGGSAESLTDLLTRMPFFNDTEPYLDFEVRFYKRAQIMAADLYLAFDGKGPGAFHDMDRLTIFADNLVPHVLRWDGILLYEKDLAARIDKAEPIPARSPEEVEIRACALHAVEKIREEMEKKGLFIRSSDLDHFLWNRGRARKYKAHPRHRTRTVFY